MCVYNCRLFDRYDCDVCSLAVLADDDPSRRPRSYQRELWGCTLRMTFPPVKLLDFRGREAELETSDNPFARFVLAHLKVLETKHNLEGNQLPDDCPCLFRPFFLFGDRGGLRISAKARRTSSRVVPVTTA
jgi:hypothetical protein